MQYLLSIYPKIHFILQGITITLEYSLLPLLLGTILGTIIAIAQLTNNRLLKILCSLYLSIIRGTPLLLQLSICYFLVPRLIGCNLSAFTAGIIAFSLNSAAYVAEIIRAGIQAVDRGQFEAARSLHISNFSTYKDVILPQAFYKILPALVNEMINLVKESAIIGAIGELDIMRRSQLIAAETYNYFFPLTVAAITYYFLVLILTVLAKTLDKKLHDKYK